MTWTDQSLNAGGTLTVLQVLPHKTIFKAIMTWPDEKPIRGEIAMDCEGALKNLERALAEDAAKEIPRA